MPSLPPYLTSGASSRSHHALLVKLHEAKSEQEEDEIVEKEIGRQKDIMNVKGQSTALLADSMIVLLHIAMIRHDTSTDMEFALVHALHLAESGRTIQEKRIGYLFLQERLSPKHELALMLINTIRKDLSSPSPSHILLALHTIVKMPSRDISPAVTPLLISKTLLKHKLPAVRQRTIQAICALHLVIPEGPFPLSMSKLVRMSSTEEDQSVLSVVVRTIRLVLERGTIPIGAQEEATFLCEHAINIAMDRNDQRGQILIECLKTLCQVVKSPYGGECESRVNDFLEALLPDLRIDHPAGRAALLEICHLVVTLRSPADIVSKRLVTVIGRGLLPPETSSSEVPHTPRPNDHVLVIRCLHILPVLIWDGQLGEAEMRALMEGLNSPDDTIRRSTLRLLRRLSPGLLEASLGSHLQALKTSTDLSLPLHVPANLEEKTIAGRLETSARALEVVEIMYYEGDMSAVEEADAGGQCARAYIQILVALNEGVLNSTVAPSSSDRSNKGKVWEEGLRRMSRNLEGSSDSFRMAFTVGILHSRIGSATLAVLRCYTLTRGSLDPNLGKEALQILLEDLTDFGPYVQEIILVALSVILSQTEYDQQPVIRSIQQVQLEAGNYIKKRCGQIVDLIQQDLLPRVMQTTESRSIPDTLEAIVAVHKKWRKSQRPTSVTSLDTPASPSYSISKEPASLRYDAYDVPSSSLGSLSHGSISREGKYSQTGMDNDHPPPPSQKTFKRNAHIQYFLRCLRALPTQAQDNDSNRITIAFFCLSGLDLLGALEEKTADEQRQGWIEWIWKLQAESGGFKGSTYMDSHSSTTSPGHLPSTYTALMCLAILRAPLDRLNIKGLSKFLISCQAKDGSFAPVPPDWMEDGGFQNDVRMTYCASVVMSVIKRYEVDIENALGFVRRCQTWEGGYSSRPGVVESQGGTSYCSVTSTSLLSTSTSNMGMIRNSELSDPGQETDTVRWLTQRQIGGFQGRPGKLEDVCYSFWIGGALSIMGHDDLLNEETNQSFLLSSQSPMGGFGKEPGDYPDPYHSYLALAALAIMKTGRELRLGELEVRWNISSKSAQWLRGEIEKLNAK